jgi:hypothetical protein
MRNRGLKDSLRIRKVLHLDVVLEAQERFRDFRFCGIVLKAVKIH